VNQAPTVQGLLYFDAPTCRNRTEVPFQQKTLLPQHKEILLLALNKAVKAEAKLVASDELKVSQQVQDSNSFYTLPI